MARAIWSGAISFGLVSIPVKLYNAVSRKSVAFNQIDARSGARVKQKLVSAADGTEVSRETCAKTAGAVFVEAFGEGVCIRYWLSGPAAGEMPIVFFTGDVLGLDAKGQRTVDPGYLTQAPEFIEIASRVWAKRLGTPMIFFGRLGLNGSDRKSTRLNSSHIPLSRMPSSA